MGTVLSDYRHIIILFRYLQFLISHIYLTNPQARIGGIAQLDFAKLEDLRNKGIANTDTFKTSATFGFQFIVLGQASLRLLEYWVSYFRPLLVTPCSETYLFLNTDGKRHQKLGGLVTAFFKPSGYHITTTALR
jgi:hypothetical protein